MLSSKYTKRLCMTEFSIQLSTIPCQHFFCTNKNEKLAAAFIYIEKGYAELSTSASTVLLSDNSLVYIPQDTFYTLKWTANEEIKYYTITAVSKDYNTAVINDKFVFQVIKQLSNKRIGILFDEIYTLMSTNERISKIKAISLYYGFYAEALEYLTTASTPSFHPVLLKVIEFIDNNYNKNHTLSEIAKECFISETRLFYLFRQQLNTTPISYRNKKRIQIAAELLKTDLSIEDICTQIGFNSVPYFYETFKKYANITPKEYRNTF